MNFRLVGLTFILIFSTVASANVDPIRLRMPINDTILRKKCHNAFEQIKAELKRKEARENFQCLLSLGRDDINDIERTFNQQCVATAHLRDPEPFTGEIVMNLGILMNSFNLTYGGLLFARCAPREAQRISNYNSTHSTDSSGGGSGMRSDCFFSNSCYAATSR
jgi:hypothetical protein